MPFAMPTVALKQRAFRLLRIPYTESLSDGLQVCPFPAIEVAVTPFWAAGKQGQTQPRRLI